MNACPACTRHLHPGLVRGEQLLPLPLPGGTTTDDGPVLLHVLQPAPGGPTRATRCGLVVQLQQTMMWEVVPG